MNIFSSTKKLFQSQKAINEMETTLGKSVNWKTSFCGILMLILTLGKIWAPANYQQKINDTIIACAAVGLINSKDHDVTGGSRQQ